jgi:RNA polymerase sigma-54 factor
VLKQELETNPLLEEVPRQETAEELKKEEDVPSDQFDEQEWREVLANADDVGGRGFRPDTSREQEELPQQAEVSLQEHLLNQLYLSDVEEDRYRIGEEIIGNIDEDGYLAVPIDEIASSVAAPSERVDEVLRIVQTFDPSGVGARDLAECLAIQIREKGLENTILMALVEDHLDDLEHHRYSVIARALDIDESNVQEAVEDLSHLNPKPAAGRFGTEARTVVPDMIVEKVDGDFVVIFNDSSLPGLRINSLYRKILAKDSDANDETRKYIVEKLNGARWLLR